MVIYCDITLCATERCTHLCHCLLASGFRVHLVRPYVSPVTTVQLSEILTVTTITQGCTAQEHIAFHHH